MKKSMYISLLAGVAVATALVAAWHLVNIGKLPLSFQQRATFDHVTLFLFPSSLILMDVDPRAPLDAELAISYLTVILSNGLLYMAVATGLGRVRRAAKG